MNPEDPEAAVLHRRHAHPDYDYCMTECHGIDRQPTYPGDGRDGWQQNLHCGREGREWTGHNEEVHWYRRKDHQEPARARAFCFPPFTTSDLFETYGQKHEY